MEILDVHRQNRLLDLIEQGAHKLAVELLKGDNDISHNELNKSLISACEHGHKFIVQKLVQLGANVNYRDTNGNTPLLLSVRNGVADIVKFLLTNKADVNACNSVGDSALILSIHSSESTEITESLLKHAGINIDHQNQDGYTAIMKAAEVKDVDTLKIFLDEYFNVGCITTASCYELINEHAIQEHITTLRETVNCTGENVHQIAERCGIGCVFQLLQELESTNISASELAVIALCHGHTECAKFYIQHGANIDFNQVLELAVGQQEPDYVRFLIENYKNELMEHLKSTSEIQDILIKSVRKGNLEIIGQILDLGADINGLVDSDVCPLAESKNGEVAKFLIDRGANVKHSKHAKQTRRYPPLIKVLINRESTDDCVIEVMKVLLENGASVNDRWNGKTPLMLAAVKEGSMSVMQLLLDHGAELCEKDKDDYTALILAIMAGCFQNVSFLLQCSTDRKELLNLQTEGFTAFMWAVRVNNSIIIKELIEAGCDVNCQNSAGLSPLMVAAQDFLKDAMCVLLDSGAEINAVSQKDNTKTALTHLLYSQDVYNEFYSCLEYLLDRGASSSYLPATALHNMIVAGEVHVVPKLIKCGLGPVCVLSNDIVLFSQYNNMNVTRLRSLAYEVDEPFHCSPLCVALCVGNSALARFFVGNLFLTNSDVFLLGHNEWIIHHLTRINNTECLYILTEITTQPMTLFNLSFVAVSTAVGATPGREIRVNKLPVPQIIKDKLLFKKQDVALTVPEEDSNSYEYDYEDYYDTDDYGLYYSDSD